MEVLLPTTLEEALELRSSRPEAVPLAGGTDVMVDLNFDRLRPDAILDLTRVDELSEWSESGGTVRIGAGLPYTRLISEAGGSLPGLAMAARTVGSPQIRNRGTVGGNLGSGSPAGDTHPVLLALKATIEVASKSARRRIPAEEFYLGPKRTTLAADELIVAVELPVARGPQQFAKIGSRNAMVIAVCSFALAIDRVGKWVGTGIGSAGPTPLRAAEAEDFLRDALEESDAWEGGRPLDRSVQQRFGELVASAALPIDDLRSTAAYRRHTLSVLGSRLLSRTQTEAAA